MIFTVTKSDMVRLKAGEEFPFKVGDEVARKMLVPCTIVKIEGNKVTLSYGYNDRGDL
jgi:hypothetical protein